MKKKLVVGIGELLWDLLPEGKQMGGAPCNFAFHAMQAGCDSFVVSAVGDDAPGLEIKQSLHSLGLSDEFIQTDASPTGTVSVSLDDSGQPDYTIHQNVAWDFIRWEEKLSKLAQKADAVCFGSLAQRIRLSKETIQNFLRAVPEKCIKVFDVNLRQQYYAKETIKASLHQANVLKLNEDELPVLATFFSIEGEVETQLEILRKRFSLEYIAYTMGSKGSILQSKLESSFVEAPKVNVADTVGAGDAFTAVLIAGILHDIPLKVTHQKATQVAAYVCQSKGAMPLISNQLIKF